MTVFDSICGKFHDNGFTRLSFPFIVITAIIIFIRCCGISVQLSAHQINDRLNIIFYLCSISQLFKQIIEIFNDILVHHFFILGGVKKIRNITKHQILQVNDRRIRSSILVLSAEQ